MAVYSGCGERYGGIGRGKRRSRRLKTDTGPLYAKSCPDHRLPLPLIAHSAAVTSSLRWIRAKGYAHGDAVAGAAHDDSGTDTLVSGYGNATDNTSSCGVGRLGAGRRYAVVAAGDYPDGRRHRHDWLRPDHLQVEKIAQAVLLTVQTHCGRGDLAGPLFHPCQAMGARCRLLRRVGRYPVPLLPAARPPLALWCISGRRVFLWL